MEESIIALDAEHEKVMARAMVYLHHPIRIRTTKLQEIRPFICRNAPEFDSQIEQWKVECGTLINYRHYQKTEPVFDYDAAVLCECPLSMDLIEKYARGAKSLCVIYRPPIWRPHEELLFSEFPTGKGCKRFMQAVAASKPTKEFASIALACGIPTAACYASNDDDLAKELVISKEDLSIIRKRAMRNSAGRKYSQIIQLVPRVEPDDKALLQLYNFIKDELPVLGHVRLARDNALSASVRFWKTALRALLRSGCIEQKEKTCFYDLSGAEPDYDKIEAEHQAAKAKLSRLIAEVDSLPEFHFRAAPPQSSVSRAQSESSARADDKAR